MKQRRQTGGFGSLTGSEGDDRKVKSSRMTTGMTCSSWWMGLLCWGWPPGCWGRGGPPKLCRNTLAPCLQHHHTVVGIYTQYLMNKPFLALLRKSCKTSRLCLQVKVWSEHISISICYQQLMWESLNLVWKDSFTASGHCMT